MEDIEGWLTREEGDFLSEEAKNKICLEIGSYKGKSASYIAIQAKKLICIDPFYIRINEQWEYDEKALVYLEFLSNTKRYQNVITIRGLSVDCAEFFINEYLDMVFIDGSHTYENVVADIQSW
ncbi:MAG: class I SAM-dependent methyltransferase, partial [Saprospiraceae bacterium]